MSLSVYCHTQFIRFNVVLSNLFRLHSLYSSFILESIIGFTMRLNQHLTCFPMLMLDTNAHSGCSRELILEASSLGLVKHAIVNCLLATEPLGSNECLTQYIQDHPESIYSIPATGICRKWIQSLVISIHNANSLGCSYNNETDMLLINGNCAADLGEALSDFQGHTGYSIMYPQCDSRTIREHSRDGKFVGILETYANYTNFLIQPTDLCGKCYIDFQRSVASTACIDGESVACIESTTVLSARNSFLHCAGQDIGFIGPSCSSAQIAKVEAFVPGPYYAITHCRYFPEDVFCLEIDDYLDKISSVTDDDCGSCFYEYANSVMPVQDEIQVCTGDEGVWAQECIAFHKNATLQFRICAGVDMDTTSKSVDESLISARTDSDMTIPKGSYPSITNTITLASLMAAAVAI